MKSIRDQAAHFPELLGFYAQSQPDRIALRHIQHEDQEPLLTSYAQLDQQARLQVCCSIIWGERAASAAC
jgi:hypothetical protein